MVVIGKGFRDSVPPLNRRSKPRSHGQHASSRIKAGHPTLVTHAQRGLSRQDSGAARDIQDSITQPDCRRFRDPWRPLLEQGRNMEMFVRCCRNDFTF